MAKVNINFNDTNYSIEESSLALATAELKSHLSTTMSGSGAVINLGGTACNVDSTKLSTAKNDFTSHLGTVAGNGYKVVVGGVEYSIDSTKMANAVSELEVVLGNLHSGSDDSETYIAGLYQAGAVDLYREQGADAIADMLVTPWEELVADGVIIVDDGVMHTLSNPDWGYNDSADNLEGDLFLSDSVTSLGNDALSDCAYTTGIVIPDSVTSIGDYAFYGCPITSIDIPDSVTSIGDYAFQQCYLNNITIPNSVTSIGEYAFNNCGSLVDIYFDGTLTEWDEIEKGYDWCTPDLNPVTIHCTDGNIVIDENSGW